jgi:AbrB family looped-hinge helix DNA binding protein
MNHGKIFGTTSMGERGLVVIPAEAREELGIQAGEKFVVFGDARKGTFIPMGIYVQ